MIEHIDEHQNCLSGLRAQVPLLETIVRQLIETFENGRRLFIMGNGGSAADAQHIAAELIGRFKQDRRALPAIALTTDTSALTAIGNDLGFDQVFVRQIRGLVSAGDVVWGLSVSGTSTNIIHAMRTAKDMGAYCVGFTGRGGTTLMDICDVCFMADHQASDRVQEMHELAYHMICDQIERYMKQQEHS